MPVAPLPQVAAPTSTTPPLFHAELLTTFISASRSGDLEALTRMLTADARIVADGGGKVPAALNVIEGAERSAAFISGAVRKGWREDFAVRFDIVNGLPGIVVTSPDRVIQTTAFDIEDGVVKAIYIVRNPDKLRHLTA